MESEGVVPLNNPTFDPKMVNHAIDLYFFPGSPPSRATLLLIKALGIKHNIKTVNLLAGEHLQPEFIKLNPMHTIPTMVDNGFVLWDSHVIMKYLVDQYAKDDSLYPKDPKKAAILNQRIFFEACTLTPQFLAYATPVLFAGDQPDPTKAAKFEEALGYLDGFLKNQVWIAGQYMTVVDFSVIAIISSAEAVMFDITKFPNVWEWYQRAKNVMATYGYEEVNQRGADAFGGMFKSKLQQ